MFNLKLIKRQLSRYVSRLKKGLRKHRRRYGTTLTALPRRPTPRASLGDLPVEVFDEVIAILHDRGDKPSMTACSLVSKTWRAVVLPHLFSTTSVREEQHFDRFLAFLDDSPHVSNCIQSLTLDGSSPGEVESEGGARLDCAAFTTVFPKLTRLRQLFLEDLTLRVTPVEICEESEESAHSRHSSPSSWLEALEVADVRCEDLEGRPLPVIPALVDMMPVHSVNLLRLDGLEDIADDSMQDFDAGVPSRAITVRHLSAVAPNGAATAAYFACYAKLVRVGSLSCISTYCETWGDAEELAAFLDLQSCSIETIDLDVTRLMQYERRPHAFTAQLPPRRWQSLAQSLFSCTSLSSLRLHMPWNRRYLSAFANPRPAIFASIFSIPAPSTLREFEVWLKLPRDWTFADARTTGNELWDLSALDRVLCDRDRFPDLQRVLVIIQSFPLVPPGCIYALEERIAEREWPRLDGRGLLYFQWYIPITDD